MAGSVCSGPCMIPLVLPSILTATLRPVAEDTLVCGSISRGDVADLVVKALRRCGDQNEAEHKQVFPLIN